MSRLEHRGDLRRKRAGNNEIMSRLEHRGDLRRKRAGNNEIMSRLEHRGDLRRKRAGNNEIMSRLEHRGDLRRKRAGNNEIMSRLEHRGDLRRKRADGLGRSLARIDLDFNTEAEKLGFSDNTSREDTHTTTDPTPAPSGRLSPLTTLLDELKPAGGCGSESPSSVEDRLSEFQTSQKSSFLFQVSATKRDESCNKTIWTSRSQQSVGPRQGVGTPACTVD
ncbi:hypothetical protein RRG08_031967 [Elysia crispata]|uniref:Uncharacterized protein n=1 Tax=Elysia crispata TaxID=231223 RepID=A0AAE0Z4A6_9GAST|nr:hypothetical protein RRG08_031967 [Elysia crispata]